MPRLAGWFEHAPPTDGVSLDRSDYLDHVCLGGYPEVARLPMATRGRWFASYVETVTQRDVVQLADVRRAAALPRLLRWAAASTGAELNVSRASRDLKLDRATVTAYLDWLRTVFFVRELPAWSRNQLKRASRRPKLHLTDTGLAAAVLGLEPRALWPATATMTGPLLESFVVSEMARQLAGADASFELFHLRDHAGHEVDVVVERADGTLLAIEVKATTSPTKQHAAGLEWMRRRLDESAPGLFAGGVLLHTGGQSANLGDRIYVRPISALWG